jgi:hypothetical protein
MARPPDGLWQELGSFYLKTAGQGRKQVTAAARRPGLPIAGGRRSEERRVENSEPVSHCASMVGVCGAYACTGGCRRAAELKVVLEANVAATRQ